MTGAYIWGGPYIQVAYIWWGGLISRWLEVHTDNFLRLDLFYMHRAGVHICCI